MSIENFNQFEQFKKLPGAYRVHFQENAHIMKLMICLIHWEGEELKEPVVSDIDYLNLDKNLARNQAKQDYTAFNRLYFDYCTCI